MYMYIYIYICIHVCVYIYIYIYIHINACNLLPHDQKTNMHAPVLFLSSVHEHAATRREPAYVKGGQYR